jgi:hypothetical protein
LSRLAPALLVLAVLAALPGCGGGSGDTLSKEDYAQQVATTGDSLSDAFGSLASTATSVDSLDELGDAVASAGDSLTAAADDLAALDPPEDAVQANTKLTEGLRALADDLDELEQAVRDGSISRIEELAADLENIAGSEAGGRIQEAIEELGSKGYDVEGESS